MEDLEAMTANWQPYDEPNMDEEINEIRAWVKERKELLQPTASV